MYNVCDVWNRDGIRCNKNPSACLLMLPATIKTYVAVFFKAIRSRCRCLHKINKFSPEAFGENKHVFACGASQLSFDIRASFFWSLPLHKQGRALAVYVQGLCDGRFLDSAWSSPQFIYPRPLDLGSDLPQFVRLKGAPYRMKQFLRFHISSHSQLPVPSSN